MLRAVFAEAPLPMFLLERDGTVRRVNNHASNVTGSGPAYASGKAFTVFVDLPFRAAVPTYLAAAVRTGLTQRTECALLGQDGVVQVQLTIEPITLPEDASTSSLSSPQPAPRPQPRLGPRHSRPGDLSNHRRRPNPSNLALHPNPSKLARHSSPGDLARDPSLSSLARDPSHGDLARRTQDPVTSPATRDPATSPATPSSSNLARYPSSSNLARHPNLSDPSKHSRQTSTKPPRHSGHPRSGGHSGHDQARPAAPPAPAAGGSANGPGPPGGPATGPGRPAQHRDHAGRADDGAADGHDDRGDPAAPREQHVQRSGDHAAVRPAAGRGVASWVTHRHQRPPSSAARSRWGRPGSGRTNWPGRYRRRPGPGSVPGRVYETGRSAVTGPPRAAGVLGTGPDGMPLPTRWGPRRC